MNIHNSFEEFTYREYEVKEIPLGYYLLYLYNFSFLIVLILFYKLFLSIILKIKILKDDINKTNKIFLELIDILNKKNENPKLVDSKINEQKSNFSVGEESKNKIIKIIEMINYNNEENKNINNHLEVNELEEKELYDSFKDEKSPTYVVGTLTDIFE